MSIAEERNNFLIECLDKLSRKFIEHDGTELFLEDEGNEE